jgi:site-specific recombinase XerD
MGGYVSDIRLKYVNAFRDRHGKMRYYVRRKGHPKVPLPGFPGSKAFMDAYHVGIGTAAVGQTTVVRAGPRSLSALFASYFNSASFRNTAEGSQSTYRKVLRPIEEKHGHRSVTDLPLEKAHKLIEDIGATRPGMANVTSSALRKAFDHAVKLRWRNDNPFIGIQRYKLGTHHTWTDEELAAYIARWRLGTRERVLFDLLYYTAQRISDVAQMKHGDIGPKGIYVKQQKTGAELVIPLHAALRRSINAYGLRGGQYLVGRRDGKRMSANSLSQVVVAAAQKAGLSDQCVTHGIRKAVLRQLAERNMGSKVIASMSGHKTLREIERYTEKADQGRMVLAAINALPDLE